jgi:predicted permease
LYRPLALEGVMLAGMAGVLSIAMCRALLALGRRYGGPYIPRIQEVAMTTDIWLAAGALVVLSALAFLAGGLLPAARAGRGQVLTHLRGQRTTSEDASARRARGWLVTGQLALTIPLLVLAALSALSLRALTHVPTGVNDGRLLSVRVSLSGDRFATEPPRADLWVRALEELRRTAGIESAALTSSRPPEGGSNLNNFELEDRPTPPDRNQPLAIWVSASPEYFSTVGLRLERGQLPERWSPNDNTIIVDRAWADRFFPGEEVIGRRLKSGGCTECPWTTVAGVVGTVKWQGLDAPDDGAVYYPFVDWPSGYVMVRTQGEPAAMADALTRALHRVDPTLALSDTATGDELTDDALATPRYLATTAAAVGVLTFVLAAAGLVAMLLHFVRQHRSEFGIRLALGGRPSDIRALVLTHSLKRVGAGLALGAGAALLVAPSAAGRLYGASDWVAWTVVSICAAMLLLAALLAVPPGRTAARVNPSELLRQS